MSRGQLILAIPVLLLFAICLGIIAWRLAN